MSSDHRRVLSRLRQNLRTTEQERARQVDFILGELGPLIRGSFLVQNVRCGKPTCKCAHGEFHLTAVLKTTERGLPVKTYVPIADRERVQRLNQRYQRVRRARRAVTELSKHTLELAGELLRLLSEPYPPPGRVKKRRKPQRRRTRPREPSS